MLNDKRSLDRGCGASQPNSDSGFVEKIKFSQDSFWKMRVVRRGSYKRGDRYEKDCTYWAIAFHIFQA